MVTRGRAAIQTTTTTTTTTVGVRLGGCCVDRRRAKTSTRARTRGRARTRRTWITTENELFRASGRRSQCARLTRGGVSVENEINRLTSKRGRGLSSREIYVKFKCNYKRRREDEEAHETHEEIYIFPSLLVVCPVVVRTPLNHQINPRRVYFLAARSFAMLLDTPAKSMYLPLQYASVLYHLCPFFTPCSIGSPLRLNLRSLVTSPSIKPRLVTIWIGLSVPVMNGRRSATMAPTPTTSATETTWNAPAYSGPKRSPACAGEATAKRLSADVDAVSAAALARSVASAETYANERASEIKSSSSVSRSIVPRRVRLFSFVSLPPRFKTRRARSPLYEKHPRTDRLTTSSTPLLSSSDPPVRPSSTRSIDRFVVVVVVVVVARTLTTRFIATRFTEEVVFTVVRIFVARALQAVVVVACVIVIIIAVVRDRAGGWMRAPLTRPRSQSSLPPSMGYV